VTDADSAPLLVVLPGLDGTGKRITEFSTRLAAGPEPRDRIETRLVVYPQDRALGYAELEQRVRAELPADRRFVLLGESFSGPIAIEIGADPPPGLLGIVLCASFARNPFPRLAWCWPLAPLLPVKSLPRGLRARFAWGSREAAAAPAGTDRASAAVSKRVLTHRIAALLRVDATAALGELRVPLLLLQASRDRIVSAAATAAIRAAAPRAECRVIEGPHLLLQARPAASAAAVRGFVQGLAAAALPAIVMAAMVMREGDARLGGFLHAASPVWHGTASAGIRPCLNPQNAR
jgi:pimeloyl-ACP methyl ester carboxylesterase